MFDFEYSPATKTAIPQTSPAEIERFLRDGSGGGIESCRNEASIPPITVALYTQRRGYAFVGGENK